MSKLLQTIGQLILSVSSLISVYTIAHVRVTISLLVKQGISSATVIFTENYSAGFLQNPNPRLKEHF